MTLRLRHWGEPFIQIRPLPYLIPEFCTERLKIDSETTGYLR